MSLHWMIITFLSSSLLSLNHVTGDFPPSHQDLEFCSNAIRSIKAYSNLTEFWRTYGYQVTVEDVVFAFNIALQQHHLLQKSAIGQFQEVCRINLNKILDAAKTQLRSIKRFLTFQWESDFEASLFSFVEDDFLFAIFPWKSLNLKSEEIHKNISHIRNYNGHLGNKCFQSFSNYQRKCQITKVCDSYFIANIASTGYLLTHQVLFSVLAQRYKCSHILNRYRPSLSDFQSNACKRIFYISKDSTIMGDENSRDFIIEMLLLCGLLGYKDFLTSENINAVISWQRKNGCFGRSKAENLSKRRLLTDKPMVADCSQHESGLATAFLALAIRYQLENKFRIRHM